MTTVAPIAQIWTIKETQYDAMGRAYRTTSPFRESSPTGNLPSLTRWNYTFYDSLSRVIQVMTPDNAAVNTAYAGNQVTVTDQAGKSRRSVTNALGHLTAVTENPGGGTGEYITNYQYDVLNNLVKVTQGAQPPRLFAYDSLSRLVAVNNPEQSFSCGFAWTDPAGNSIWTMGYTYDSNGNLLTRSDADARVTTYAYDALNRPLTVRYNNYNNGSADTDFTYDTATNGKGRFATAINKSTRWYSTADSPNYKPYWHKEAVSAYDALGRPTAKSQGFMMFSAPNVPTTWKDYTMSRTYNAAGMITSETYPSGRVVSYGYDVAGRGNSFTGNLGDGNQRNYATGTIYNEANQMTCEVFGTTTPLYHKRKYNLRYQLCDLKVSDSPSPTDNTWTHGWLNYQYGPGTADSANNNGNVLAVDSWAKKTDNSGNWVMHQDKYEYDALNRLFRFTESGKSVASPSTLTEYFKQTFEYDRWGNRTNQTVTETTAGSSGLPTPQAITINPNTNRISSVNGYNLLSSDYTNSGNLRKLFVPGATHTAYYDNENRMTRYYIPSTNNSYYFYDAGGKRVRRVIGGQETWQVYGFEGELKAEYNLAGQFDGVTCPAPASPTKEYGYRGGQLLVVSDSTETDPNQKFKWLVTDHLGSTRMEVGSTGSLATTRRHDYAPFGEELFGGQRGTMGYGYTTAGSRQKFGTYERDDETGLDFAEARYFSSVQGRFTSPDSFIGSARRLVPQSWNRYSYVINNPLKYTDPTGLDWIRGSSGNTFWDPNVHNPNDLKRLYGKGYSIVNGQTLVVGSSNHPGLKAGHLYTFNANGTTTYRGAYNPPAPTLPVIQDVGVRLAATYIVAAKYLAQNGGNPAGATADLLLDASDIAFGSEDDVDPTLLEMGVSVQANKAAGDAFRDEVADELRRAGKYVETEVRVETPFGARVHDIHVYDRQGGTLQGAVEAKVGGSRYHTAQRTKDKYLRLVRKLVTQVIRKGKG
ncbi:MAG: RHS repeat-associated core domain-containing protein [Acidobacteria bacterium]|nr:RHS repeat-associated core domain-containing protein [Acidobacteriota bacterium]